MPTLSIVDLTPKFLTFYEQAQGVTDQEERWKLWQALYGFAAVPPTPQGKVRARELLEQAWNKYKDHLDLFVSGAQSLQPAPAPVLQSVCDLLDHQAVAVQLIVFVGGFEDNAFAYANGGQYNVCLPIEQSARKRALVLPHEFTHAVHLAKAGLTGSWERSIAQLILEEGLATRCTEKLVPNRMTTDYLGEEAWLTRCRSQATQIYQGLLPCLAKEDGQTVYQFTMGQGTTGIEREAYYAGWHVVGWLLAQGWSLANLAGLPAAELPALVNQALSALLKGDNGRAA